MNIIVLLENHGCLHSNHSLECVVMLAPSCLKLAGKASMKSTANNNNPCFHVIEDPIQHFLLLQITMHILLSVK